MTKYFLNEFKKRLIKGLLIGCAIFALIVVFSIFSDSGIFNTFPWYMIPVLFVITLLYGTGWYFAFNLIKRAWRKFLRVNEEASIWQSITGRGLIWGVCYSILCFIGGCIIALFVGNFFMVMDFLLAQKGEPPMSAKYKFDSDLSYDNWRLEVIKAATDYADAVGGTSVKQKADNQKAIEDIENGNSGTITTVVDENGKKTTKKTTIF